MEFETKKIVVPTIIAIAVLGLLTVGATYAYFTFASNNNFKTPATIKASTGALGSGVSLKKSANSDLSLNLSASQMLKQGNNVTYYASGSSTPKTIATVSVAGAGTFNCTYTLEITKTATNDLYTKFQSMSTKSAGQVYLKVNSTTYDFNTANLFTNNKITYRGTLSNITSAAPSNITANLVVVNHNTIDQTELNGSDITLSIVATAFNCTLVE